jgi:hypothetical protein
MRGAEHSHLSDLAPVEELAGDDRRLDGLADTDVVGDEQPHRIELERHHQRHELVRPGLGGDAAEAPEGTRRGARREARRVAQELPCGEVAEIGFAGKPERRR